MKHNFKSNRKAFTLIELLIVIAIIGILFVVLVSKVDFATDKAKTTGVQTDFRSFQVALETVSRENAGFNTLGWDTGDKADNSLLAGYTYENADKDGGDRIRNSYDKGDLNLNGICEEGETWTGQKLYTETWTGIYTLDNPADATDMSAYLALEKAINKNLDPALQISIDPENKTIFMANGYQDPWNTEYHGFYLTNAAVDGKDRGAIVMYSDGPNKVFGSDQTIANGIVSVTIKNGAVQGQDDLSIVTSYTYVNGYGENTTITTGFSNNQQMQVGGNGGLNVVPSEGPGKGGYEMLSGSNIIVNTIDDFIVRSSAPCGEFKEVKVNGDVVDPSNYTVTEGSTIITFTPAYLATLPMGNVEVEIVSNDGTAKCCLEYTQCIHLNGFNSQKQCKTCDYECNCESVESVYVFVSPEIAVPGHYSIETCTVCGYEFDDTQTWKVDCTIENGFCVYCKAACIHYYGNTCYVNNGVCTGCGWTCEHPYWNVEGDFDRICINCSFICYHENKDTDCYCPVCETNPAHDETYYYNGQCVDCGAIRNDD